MRRSVITSLLLITALFATPPAFAQADWPKGPVKVIVPFPPGGANDIVARPYADALSRYFNQPFIIENRGGAGGAVGMETLIRSKPDGYTFCMCASTVISTVSNLRKVNFQATDVDVVAVTTMYISGLMVGPKNPANNFQEFLAYAKANPGKIVYGGSGVGSPTELRMKFLAQVAGLDMVSVPYNGNAPALNDLLSGVIDGIIELNGFPHVKAGKLRLLALFSEQRHPDFPDTPTMAELGFPQVNTPIWQGFYAPLGVPELIREKMNRAIAEISAQPEMKAKLLALGFATRTMSLAEVRRFYLDDDALHKKIIRDAKISVD